MVNALYEFSKLVAKVLGELRNTKVVSYLNDILIPAKDYEDMLERLKLVLEALIQAKMTLKTDKCSFGQNTVKFLGYELTGEGMKPGDVKCEAIWKFPKPKNRKEMRRFLGFTVYFRRFVPNYAMVAKPLTDLTRGKVEYLWKKEQEMSFQELKTKLMEAPQREVMKQ